MSRNDKELAVVRKQLAGIERALESLRRGIENPRQFEVFSEAYVDQIAELKAEIDSYRPAGEQKRPAGGNQELPQAPEDVILCPHLRRDLDPSGRL